MTATTTVTTTIPANDSQLKALLKESLEMGAKPILPKKKTVAKKVAAAPVKPLAKAQLKKAAAAPAKPAKKVASKKRNASEEQAKANDITDGNTIVLKQICQELKIEPRIARRKLRKAGISGHDHRDRWTFTRGSRAELKAREVLAPATAE